VAAYRRSDRVSAVLSWACCSAGWGTNEALIISILGHRDAAQRRAIRRAYAEAYGQELLRSITDEISGDFEVRTNLGSHPREYFSTPRSLSL
jgi:hypothetical protein